MTNEDKAREIARTPIFLHHTSAEFGAEYGAKKMAEWKDKQCAKILKEECNTSYESGFDEGERKAEARFKEYLEKKIHTIESMGDIDTILPTDTAIIRTIKEIIKEFFKED